MKIILCLVALMFEGGSPKRDMRASIIKMLEEGAAQAALSLIEEAVAFGGEAILEDGLSPSLYHYAGIASQMLGDLDSAIAGYRKALEVL